MCINLLAMQERPKIKPIQQPVDKVTEIAAFALLAGLWVYAINVYAKMPQIVPTHFDLAGKADAYGDKDSLFAMPVIATVMFVLLSLVQRIPHLYNYPVEITPENAQRQYGMGVRLMRMLKIVIVLVFFFAEFYTTQAALGEGESIGPWLLPIIFGLIFIPTGYYLIKAVRSK